MHTFLYENKDPRYDKLSHKLIYDKMMLILSKDTLRLILFQYVYGHLRVKLDELDKIRLSVSNKYYAFDACESDIKNKMGIKSGRREVKLDISTFRVCGYLCNWIGDIKWLPKCGESYNRIFQEHLGGNIIARNMLHSKDIGEIMNPFIASDVGSESNPENVRLAIVNGIMDKHEMKLDEYEYISPETNNKFDLRDFRLNVCI